MSRTTAEPCGPRRTNHYEIRLAGHLADRWAAWFDGLDLTRESNGMTLLDGDVVDQSALHGLLQKVRDTGLDLVSVIQVEPDDRPEPTTNHR